MFIATNKWKMHSQSDRKYLLNKAKSTLKLCTLLLKITRLGRCSIPYQC